MEKEFDLERFINAQNSFGTYDRAVEELQNGRKRSHWIWFILPQIKGLGHSYNSNFYGIDGIEESKSYLADSELSERLRRVVEILINWGNKGKSMEELLGHIDAVKAKSCLTLFDAASPNDIFATALDVCYKGERDKMTLLKIQNA